MSSARGDAATARLLWGALAVAAAVVPLGVWGVFGSHIPPGADTMLHVNDAACFADALRFADWGLWCGGGGYGYPLALPYQPVTALALAVFALIGVSLLVAMKALMVLLALAQPLSFALGARLAGAGAVRAISFGIVCGTLVEGGNYGITPRAFLWAGLVTQSVGVVLAPLAVGLAVAFVRDAKRPVLTAFVVSMLILTHPIIALWACAFGVLALWAACGGPGRWSWRRIGLLSAACLGPALVLIAPAVLSSGEHERFTFTPGTVIAGLFAGVVRGTHVDAGRLPLVTLLALVGGVRATRRVQAGDRRWLAAPALLLLLCAWVAIAPKLPSLPASLLMTARVVPAAQVLLAWLAADALSWGFQRVPREMPWLQLGLALVLAATAARDHARTLDADRAWRGSEAAFVAAADALRLLPPGPIGVVGPSARPWENALRSETGHPSAQAWAGAAASASRFYRSATIEEVLQRPWLYGLTGALASRAHPVPGARSLGCAGDLCAFAWDAPALVTGMTSRSTLRAQEVAVSGARVQARITSDIAERALVRISFHPWWRAAIDGRVIDASPTKERLLTVPVPAGTHELILRFVRPTWWWALVVTGPLGWLALAFVGRAAPRRSGGSFFRGPP